MAMEYTHDINAYVEQAINYGANKVVAKLDETAKKVTLELVDAYGVVVADAPKLVNETFTTVGTAIKYYEEVIHQLSQGDIVRNYKRAEVVLRDPSDNEANRFPSF